MDGGEDEYEERLKELFHSFDGAGRGALDPDELSDLCQSLQLDDAAPVLLQTLLQGRDRLTATVDFNQFKNALILVLSSTAEPAPEDEEEVEQEDEETLQEPGSPEVQPKFVKGSKRYGRRSTPEFMACISGRSEDVNPDDEEDLEDNGDSAVPRKRERWNAHDTSTEEYEAEGQLQLWNPDEPSRGPAVPPSARLQEKLREACEDLGINWDGCAARSELLVLCDHLGLEPGVEALGLTGDGVVNVQEFVSSLVNQYKPPTPSSSSTPYRQLKRHHSTQPFDEGGRRTSVLCSTIGTRLFSTLDDGSGHSAAESVLDAWMEEGVENSADILQALNFDLDGKLSLSELTAALENELLVTKSGVHRAALASFRAEIRHLLECVDREIREKEKIRSDLEKAEKQKIQLATEVDEHHSAIEHTNNLNLRKLEQEHREKLALVRTELLGELDLIQQQAALQRVELEEEISKIREDETFLRDHLSISVKENRRLEMELLDGAEKLLEAQTHISRLQTSLDEITRDKFGELDPGSADFLLQEEKFRQLRAGYEAQCRELQDRIDELQAELRSFTALGRAPDPGPKPLSEELESKSPGTESDPGIGSEEVQPFAMSLEAEMMLEQLKEQHLQEVEDLQHQLESKINEFNEAAEKQRSAHEEQAAAAARQNQREVQALRDDMAGLRSFTQELQSQLEQAELERAELEQSRAEELQNPREEEAARLEEQMAALKAQQAAEMDKLTEEREELQQERAELQNRQEDAAARLLEAHAAELGRMEEQMAALKAQQAAEMDKLAEERAELQQERAELQQERAELQNRQEEEAARLLEAHSAELKEEQAAEVEARLAEEREVLQQEREELQQKRAELQNRWEKEAARLLEAHAAELGKMEELKEEQAALLEARLAEEREELQQERAELQNWREEEAARLLEAHAADLGRLEEQMTALKAQRAAEMDKLTEEREELQQERAELQNQREEEATRLLEAHAADPGRMEELRNQQAADERAELQQEREELERRLLADWDRQKKALEENHEEILRARLEEATVRFEQERDGVEAALTERWREEKARLDEQSAETLQLLLEEEMLRLVREQEEKEGGMTERWERERAQLQDRLLGEREQFQRREERLREEWETERLQLEEDYEGMIRDRLEEEREKLRGEREQEERLMEEEREKLRGEREQEERRAERRMEEERERLEEIHRDAVKELRAKHAEERDELAAALDKLRDDISRERKEVELSFVLRLREVEERFSSDQDSSAGRFQADVLRLERHYQSELASLSERHAEQTLLWESELAAAVAVATEERAGLQRGWEEERAALAGEHAQEVEALRAESRLLQEQMEEAAGTAQRTDIQLSRQLNELHGRLQEQHTLRADAELLLARTVEDFRGERVELLARAEEMEAEREELTGKVEELEAKNAELEAKNTEVVEELEAKNAELEAKNAELEAKNAELVEELAAKNAELEAKNAELEAKNAELEAKNTELEAKRDELTAKVEELEAKNAELEAKNVELDARNAELEAKNAELEAKNAELEAKVEELEAKNAELEAKNAELEAKNAELEAKNAELEAKNAELEAKRDELTAKVEELEAKNAELEAKDAELEATDAELEATDAELEAKRDELLSVSENQVAEGIQQIQAERDDLTAKVSELEVKHAELEELLKQAALDFQLEREELIARASELEAKHQELTAKVEELEAKVEELEVKHADLLAGSESRGAEGIRRIQVERDNLAAKVSELEAKNAELEELLKQAALDFQLEREELQENLTAAEAELRDERERGAEREQLRVKVEQLRVEVCRLSAPAGKPADEADEASDARQDGVEDARDAGGDGDAPDEPAEALESRNHDDELQNPPEGEHGQLREATAAGSRPEEAGIPGQRPADDAEANTREETECEGLLGVRASHAAAAAEEKLLLQQKISLLQQKTEILENLLAHHGDRVSAGRRALEENYGLKVQMLLLMEQLRQLEAAALASACENARLQEQNGDLERRVRSLEGGGDVVYGDEDGPAVLAGEVRRMRAENAELLRLLGEVERQDETPDGGETPAEAEAFLDLEEEDEEEEEEEDKPLQDSCRRSERRNGELRRALAALQDRSQALDQTTRAQRSETSRLAEENGVLRQKISALKDGDLRDVQEELIQTLEHLKKEKFAAQKAEDHFKKQISELRSQSRQLQDENGLLVERQAENAADSDGLRRRLAALATEELPPEDESETAACVLALEAELTRSLEDAARLQTRNELLSRQLSDLGEKVKTAEESLQAVGRQSSRLRTDLRVLQQERDALKQEVAALQKQLQNANDKNQMLELALHSGGLQNQSQNKKLLREERSRLLEQTLLRQENERLQAEVRGVRADLLQAREKVRQLDAALLKHKQPGQRSLVRALEQENQALKQELQELQAQQDQTQGTGTGAGRSCTELESLQQENEALKAQMARLSSQVLETFQAQLVGLLPPSPHRVPRHRGDDPDNGQGAVPEQRAAHADSYRRIGGL